MFQPNLRMADTDGLDGRALVRRCREYGANAVLANAGGIVAWYPTALPYHWRNPGLEHDFVGAVTAEARRLGMRVLLRMDWSCLVPEIGRRHRDWLALDADGAPRMEWRGSRRPLMQTCAYRPGWREAAFAELAELMTRYPVDGFFFNAWNVPECHCPTCRRACREALGIRLPAGIPWETPLGRRIQRWRAERHAAFTKALRGRLHAFGTGTLLSVDFHLANDFPHHLARAAWDGALLAGAVDLVTVEAFNFLTRPRPHWPFWAAESARMIRSFPSGTPGIVLLSGSERWTGRRPAQPPEQVERDLRQIVAHGANPCVAVSGDFRQEDRKVLPVVKRVFRELERRGPPRSPPSVRAPLALVYGQRSMDAYGGAASRERALFHYRGWYEALESGRVPFTVVHDGALAETLAARRGLKALVLPNCACLDEAACRAVDGWVRRGGRLIATFETSRYDALGRRRRGFGLAALGRRPGRTVEIPGTWFTAGGAGRRWVGAHTSIHPVSGEFLLTRGAGAGALRLMEWGFNNKPEWSRPERALNQYGLYLRRYGRGRVAYLPWSPGKLYHACRSPEHRDLLLRLAEGVRS